MVGEREREERGVSEMGGGGIIEERGNTSVKKRVQKRYTEDAKSAARIIKKRTGEKKS